MGVGSIAKRRRSGTESSANSATPSRVRPVGTGRRGRPPNVPRDGRERPPSVSECFKKRCGDVLDRLSKKDHYNIFLEPVNTNDVAGYAETIKHPMDFTTMRTKLADQVYKSLGEFRKDLDLIWSNCLLFNGKEPTNIFSKKAIELRRLTEKLIVTTRQHLEKDKENLLKWKEKHRRRKETMQANAANANAAIHGTNLMVPKSVAARIPRPVSNTGASDPMDTTANEYAAEEQNGRTPEENALSESLRLQYSGTTGLYRKGMLNAPFPQYTRPDGSIVQIPIRRYHPDEDHWHCEPSGVVHASRHTSAPPLLCNSLPRSRPRNPCYPRTNIESVKVRDYAASLYQFVTDTGSIATQIVTELLSPELLIKKKQDEFLKQGYTLKDLAEKERQEALRAKELEASVAESKWDADAIAKLADDIEKANHRVISMLPKLSRPLSELDGVNGLARYIDKKLLKEVEDVPVQVVDFAMPHGVSLSTLTEICRLKNAPSIRLSQNDLQILESLRKGAEDYLRTIGPDAATKMTGASLLTPSQLHEVQMRARQIRAHRCVEAKRQADIIRERLRGPKVNQADSSVAQHKRDLESLIQSSERAERAGMAAARAAAGAAYRTAPQQRAVEAAVAKARSDAISRELQGVTAAINQQTGSSHSGHPQPSMTHTQAAVGSMPSADKSSVCSYCGTKDAVGWRGGNGNHGIENLCIPCGLYWQKTNRQRPKEVWGEAAQRTGRAAPTAAVTNGSIQSRGVAQQGISTSLATSNGVAKRPIQKYSRTPSSSSRRSPSSSGSRGKPVAPRMGTVPPLNHGVQPAHTVQPLTSIAHGYAGVNSQTVQAQSQNAAQLFTNQRNNMDARNAMAAQKLQSLQSSQHTSSGAVFTSAAGTNMPSQTHIHPSTQPGMNALMYRDQHSESGLGSLPLMSLVSQGQPAALMAIQKHQMLQQSVARQQQLGTAKLSSSSSPGYSAATQPNNTSGMLLNGSAGGENLIPNVSVNMLQNVNNGQVAMDTEQRGNASVGNATGMGNNVGNGGMSSFVSQGMTSAAMLGNFGESVARGAFGNGSGVNGGGVGTAQLVDEMLFPDGAIDAPSGSPDFGF